MTRAKWRETGRTIVNWCEEFFSREGRIPSWAEVMKGTGKGSSSLSRHFVPWRGKKLAELQAEKLIPKESKLFVISDLSKAMETVLNMVLVPIEKLVAVTSVFEQLGELNGELIARKVDMAHKAKILEEVVKEEMVAAAATIDQKERECEVLRTEAKALRDVLREKDEALEKACSKQAEQQKDIESLIRWIEQLENGANETAPAPKVTELKRSRREYIPACDVTAVGRGPWTDADR